MVDRRRKTMGLADLHLHTIYSYDGTASLAAVLARAKAAGLDLIAITDHDEIKGALKALELASSYGVEVIPGIEITTADGDLLALFIKEKVEAGLSLIETVLRVRKLGGICIAPHPMAGGMGMKSLKARTIMKALRNPQVAETLVGIEVYNATAIDRISNHSANLLASRLQIAKTGSSDAHVADAIGSGMTEFEGSTASDLLKALKDGSPRIRRNSEWSPFQVMGSWAVNYIGSRLLRMSISTN